MTEPVASPPPPGTIRPRSKLTPADVSKIRQLAAEGVSLRRLCLDYRVGATCINDIVRRKTFKSIP
jgi:hypothetical protein